MYALVENNVSDIIDARRNHGDQEVCKISNKTFVIKYKLFQSHTKLKKTTSLFLSNILKGRFI